MTEENETGAIVHYICQTYVEQKGTRGKPSGLKIGKQLQYTTAREAENRAERELRSEGCIGVDAYMIVEDPASGEVGDPTFLVRLGNVPDDDAS